MPKVTVYRFRLYDIRSDQTIVSRRMGTSVAIERARGEPIDDSALEADVSELDPAEDGFTPIGWRPQPR